jgi:serine/threonine protein kinase
MTYPTFEQYDEALQNPAHAFSDPELKTGLVKKNGLGLPLALCGGFALTYTLTCRRNKYAVRCFHKRSNALEQRYNAISRKLLSLSSHSFLSFNFQPQGIRVNNNQYPIVKMAWGLGEELGSFIENNYTQKISIQNLKRAFRTLSDFLLKNGIAHGDIQNGNLLISSDGTKIQLIDYDGMYVDEIKGLGNVECGHKNFQHPRRTSQFDRYLDRFSLISIYLALHALELDKTLWSLSKPDGESIVFKANDYAKPSNSAIFSLLFSKPELTQAVKNFAAICEASYDKIPSLEDFIRGKNIPQAVISISSKPQVDDSLSYISQYPVLDARNYSVCQGYVGDRVELVGKIANVKCGNTRYGKPYIFINFGDWREDNLKINIWSDALDKFKNPPTRSWAGNWVSVVGLMDPPYTGQTGQYVSKRNYTNLSITLTGDNHLYVIDEREANYRLKPSESSKRNVDVIQSMDGADVSPAVAQSGFSRNQEILGQIQGASTKFPKARPPVSSSAAAGSTSATQRSYSRGSASSSTGCLAWFILFILLLFAATT